MTTLTNITNESASIAERLCQSTVKVRCSWGGGSGAIWQPDGLMITNAHVAISKTATVELWDGRVFDAVRTHFDPQRDLAALKITATDLPTATIGKSNGLRVGELVLAVGNPFGDRGAVTTGIIHASNQRAVMADIQLFPGNSGGPLADCLGRIVGINTMIVNGLAVAIPSEAVEHFLSGSSRPTLGVTVQPVLVKTEDATSRQNKDALGLLVLSVNSGSTAEAAGLQIGDVLIGVSGKLFTRPHDLSNYLNRTDTRELLPLQVIRGGRQLVCHVAEVA